MIRIHVFTTTSTPTISMATIQFENVSAMCCMRGVAICSYISRRYVSFRNTRFSLSMPSVHAWSKISSIILLPTSKKIREIFKYSVILRRCMEILCHRCLRRIEATIQRIYITSHTMSLAKSVRDRELYKTTLMRELERLRLLYMKPCSKKIY